MRVRVWVISSLVFLAAAAAPPSDCIPVRSQSVYSSATSPDFRPGIMVDLAGNTVAARPDLDTPPACPAGTAAANSAETARDSASDILHGLPVLELLRPPGAPQFMSPN